METPRTVDQVLYEDYIAGRITIHEAARKFHSCGWTNFVDEGFTRRTFLRIAAGRFPVLPNKTL